MSAPPVDQVHEDDLEYHRIYRARREGWGWYAGGIASMAAMFVVVNVVAVTAVFAAYFLATGTPAAELEAEITDLADLTVATPVKLAFLNLVLIAAIPAAWGIALLFHEVRPRWLASVAPRIRWRWLAASFGVSVVTLLLAVVLGTLLPATEGDSLSGDLNSFTDTTRDFLLVVVLLTPLQAVAEEYVFRGYLTQAFGGIVADLRVARYLAVVGPALLFALAHGSQSFPIFVDRLAFGLTAGILVIATGGLEAGIAYHVLNNLLAYGFALAFSDMTTALNPEGGTWWDVLLSIVKSVVFVVLAVWAARRMGIATTVPRTELVAPRARV